MSTTAVPIIRGEGEGERRWFAGGGVHTMKATAEETDGAFMLLENRMVQGKTTPLHIHPNLDETLIVLEGEILVYAAPTGLASGQLLSATPTLYRSSVRLRSRWPRRVPLLPDPRVIAGN
jgi:anti-sigma factor ChrR (cupin superfamily)